MSNTFKFSSRSEKNLQGVNPDLVKVTRRALEISEVDFGALLQIVGGDKLIIPFC